MDQRFKTPEKRFLMKDGLMYKNHRLACNPTSPALDLPIRMN